MLNGNLDKAVELAQEIGMTETRLKSLKTEFEKLFTDKVNGHETNGADKPFTIEVQGERNPRRDILKFVRKHHNQTATLQEICKRFTDETPAVINYYLKALVDDGKLKRPRRGYYMLPARK